MNDFFNFENNYLNAFDNNQLNNQNFNNLDQDVFSSATSIKTLMNTMNNNNQNSDYDNLRSHTLDNFDMSNIKNNNKFNNEFDNYKYQQELQNNLKKELNDEILIKKTKFLKKKKNIKNNKKIKNDKKNNYNFGIIENVKEILLLTFIYYILSTEPIRNIFTFFIKITNMDSNGNISYLGIIIYGLIIATIFVALRNIILFKYYKN